MASMKLGGIDNLFFVSGSEIAFYQESAAKAREREWPSPRLITMTHEGAALHAALGNAMVSGQPAATAVHVDVGTLNYGARHPYRMARRLSRAHDRRHRPPRLPRHDARRPRRGHPVGAGARDQGEILRQYTKHDHRLEHLDNPRPDGQPPTAGGHERPAGARLHDGAPGGGHAADARHDSISHARPARSRTSRVPDPRDAKTAAEWLVKANNPVICLAKSGATRGRWKRSFGWPSCWGCPSERRRRTR